MHGHAMLEGDSARFLNIVQPSAHACEKQGSAAVSLCRTVYIVKFVELSSEMCKTFNDLYFLSSPS